MAERCHQDPSQPLLAARYVINRLSAVKGVAGKVTCITRDTHQVRWCPLAWRETGHRLGCLAFFKVIYLFISVAVCRLFLVAMGKATVCPHCGSFSWCRAQARAQLSSCQ